MSTMPTSRRDSWKQAALPGDFQTLTNDSDRTARDWLVDWVVFFVSVGIGALTWVENDGRLWLLNAAGGAIVCIALFWRRSHPLAVGVIASVGSCFAGAAGMAWLVALYNSSLRLDRKGLAWVLIIGAIGCITYPMIYPSDMGLLALTVLCIGAAGTALGLGALARARREHVIALAAAGQVAEGEQRLREQQAREAERHRIAREMHDVLAHRISLLSLHAGALEYRPDVPPEEIAKAAGVIRSAAQDALQELRDVIGVMRTGADEGHDPPQSDVADIPKLIDRFREAGLRIDCEYDGALDAEIPPAAGRTLFRVVQEGLTNASKHAPGAVVSVAIERPVSSRVRVTVTNPLSISADVAPVTLPDPGVGLVGLAERTALAGGTLKHGIDDDSRFRLVAEVPTTDG